MTGYQKRRRRWTAADVETLIGPIAAYMVRLNHQGFGSDEAQGQCATASSTTTS